MKALSVRLCGFVLAFAVTARTAAESDVPAPSNSTAESAAANPGGSSAATPPAADSDSHNVELALAEAVRIAVEHNLDVRLARLDDAIGQRSVVIARSAFDPFFNVSASFAKNRDPTVSFLDVGTGVQGVTVNPSEITSYSAGLNGTWLTGATYQLQLQQNAFDRPAAAAGGITRLNPINRTDVVADLRQPLLKGAWFGVNSAEIRIARNDLDLTRYEFERLLADTIYEVEAGYWELTFALQNLAATQSSVAVSTQNLDNARKNREAGRYSDNDVRIAESQLYLRKVEFQEAELLAANARDALLNRINYAGEISLRQRRSSGDRRGSYDHLRVRCTTEPSLEMPQLDPDAAVALAFELRPEYRQLATRIGTQSIRLEVARSELLPALDIFGRWTQLGMEETYDDAYRSLGRGNFYDWLVGVEMSVPLSNRGPRSRYRNARSENVKLYLERQALENSIVLEVDLAARTLRNLRDRSIDLDAQVQVQAQLLADERSNLAAGRTIPYAVTVVENDLVASRTAALRAKADLEIAKADYYRATGQLLRRYGIVVLESD